MTTATFESFWHNFGIQVSQEYKRIEFSCEYLEKVNSNKMQKNMVERVTGLPWNHLWCQRLLRQAWCEYHNVNGRMWEEWGL